VELKRVPASAVLAVPLTMGAVVGCAVLGPLIEGLGVSSGSFLDFACGVAITAGVGHAAGRWLTRPEIRANVHQRGTVVEGSQPTGSTGEPMNGRLSAASLSAAHAHAHARAGGRDQIRDPDGTRVRDRERQAITLAGMPIAPLDETKHFKLIGTTGTGKSTAIRELLTGALRRGDRAIIADPDGGYLSRFADPARGDIVLNPFDPASSKWDLFGEIDNPYDVDQLARSLLPDPGGPDRSWIGYARTFFTSVTRQAHEAGVTNIRDLYDLLVVTEAKELRGLLAGTPAQPFLEEHNGRMFDSIRSVTSSAVASLDYIAQQTTDPLSIRQWVRDGYSKAESAPRTQPAAGSSEQEQQGQGRGGVLFIPYKAGQIAALRSTISAWMRLAIFETMSQPEGDQRLWFVVDELDALGQIDGLKDALARLRKFGGRCVLGFQSISQVSSTYGSGEAQTIVENCGNTLILRCSGSEHGGTANFASRLIGQREVLRTNRSRSHRPTDFLSSTTLSEHVAIEPAVMDSQIEQLPDLTGYLKFASQPHWRHVALRPDSGAASEATSGSANTKADGNVSWSTIRARARYFWREWQDKASGTEFSADERTGRSTARDPSVNERASRPAGRDSSSEAATQKDMDYE
jgi:hypothetical protein